MTDAPEKIFATGSSTTGSWNHVPLSARISPAQTEYTRTDVAEARIAELEAALLTIKDWEAGPSGKTVAEMYMRAVACEALKAKT